MIVIENLKVVIDLLHRDIEGLDYGVNNVVNIVHFHVEVVLQDFEENILLEGVVDCN